MTTAEASPKKNRYYGTTKAAERLEVAPVTVRQWCQDKDIPAIKMGKKLWKIPVDWVEARVAAMLDGKGGSILLDEKR